TMQIQHVKLHTVDLAQQQPFYTQTLGLPLAHSAPGTFTVQMGKTALTFSVAETPHIHHIAINIPPQQFESALAWTEARVPLLPFNGKKIIDFSKSTWQARSLYFEDPGGNVIEFIARERVAVPDAPDDFALEHLIGISEVGLASDNVRGLVAELRAALDVPVFDGDPETGFCALGDDSGLLICVETGRNWLPTDNRPSGVYPVEMTISGDSPGTHTFYDGAYTVRVT
ncbi:MAG: hypothetical protein AAF787_23685, partial [Chloroflexota bacterium]